MNKSAVIVAAGSGIRMGANIPKQFILLKGLPILMHTISRFHEYDPNINIIVVLPANENDRWNSLCVQYSFTVKHKVVAGGETRFDSVQKGLVEIDSGFIAVHDGVRPIVTTALIAKCFDEAAIYSNAIPAIPVTDTIRVEENEDSKTIDRLNLRQIQTPQCFDVLKLKKAYSACSGKNFTDDAGVFESDGNKIHLVTGEKLNIKITDPADLLIANAVIASENQ